MSEIWIGTEHFGASCSEDLGTGLSTLTRWLSQERDVIEPGEAPVDLHAALK